MELFSGTTSQEEFLVVKARFYHIPIGGTLELLPLCNMNCKMCYIRQSPEEMQKYGQFLSSEQWLQIIKSAVDAGVLFLQFTGGEPLLYPEFKELYTEILKMGIIVTVNTNGTLIDSEWADFFSEHPCRRLNITLYGKDNETYANLCGNPDGYSQVMHAVSLLQERNIPFRFNFTATPYNADQLPDLYNMAREMDILMEYTNYVFPPLRRHKSVRDIERLSAEECGRILLEGTYCRNHTIPKDWHAKAWLKQLEMPARNQQAGYHCSAGYCGFWINWKGELLPCGMFDQFKCSLLEYSFKDAWNIVGSAFRDLPVCEKCENCSKRNLCQVCPAACYTETGSVTEAPEYLCKATDAAIRKAIEDLPMDEQSKYSNLNNTIS